MIFTHHHWAPLPIPMLGMGESRQIQSCLRMQKVCKHLVWHCLADVEIFRPGNSGEWKGRLIALLSNQAVWTIRGKAMQSNHTRRQEVQLPVVVILSAYICWPVQGNNLDLDLVTLIWGDDSSILPSSPFSSWEVTKEILS